MKFKGLQAAECTDDLVDLFGAARAWTDGRPFELYHRKALTLRRRRRPGEKDRVESGVEDGLALRLRLPPPNGLVFAAGSGCTARTLRELVDRARSGFGATGDADPWPAIETSLEDLDADFGLPEDDRAALWLDEALDRLAPIAERAGAAVADAAIEIAATVESWAASPGLRATRSRSRAWAVADLIPAPGSRRSFRALRVAARHWARLDPAAWARVLEDRMWPASDVGGSRTGGPAAPETPVLLNPEAASSWLRPALARATASGALRVRDLPRDPDALFGGDFDDACEATADRALPTGAGAGRPDAGRLRRGSFREPPRPAIAAPTVEPAPVELPGRLFLATGLRIHPSGAGGASVELEGGWLESGRPRAGLASAWVRLPPERWLERALGTVGPSRADHLGARTPAILFDALPLDGC